MGSSLRLASKIHFLISQLLVLEYTIYSVTASLFNDEVACSHYWIDCFCVKDQAL